MNKLLRASFVLIFFSFSLILFQFSCQSIADAEPVLSVDEAIKPLNQIFYFKADTIAKEQLWVANYDGSNQRVFLVLPENLNFISETVSVAPDGKTIFMTLNEVINSNTENTSVYSVNADGTGLKKIISGTDGLGEVGLAAAW